MSKIDKRRAYGKLKKQKDNPFTIRDVGLYFANLSRKTLLFEHFTDKYIFSLSKSAALCKTGYHNLAWDL